MFDVGKRTTMLMVPPGDVAATLLLVAGTRFSADIGWRQRPVAAEMAGPEWSTEERA
jgi:hypothetical protein